MLEKGPIREAYEQLFILYTVQQLEELSHLALLSGALQPEHLARIQELKEGIYDFLTPRALTLAEAVPYSDYHLRSAIGHSNGKPYDNLLSWAKQYNSVNKLGGPHPFLAKEYSKFQKGQLEKLLKEEGRTEPYKL